MKLLKSFLALSVLASITSFAHADDKTSLNNFFGGVSVGSFSISGSDEKSSTAYGVNGGYRYYFTDKLSADGSVAYFGTNSNSSDTFVIPTVGLAYDFKLDNGVTVRPSIGVGYHFDKFDGGNDSNSAYRVGIDVQFKNNVSAGLGIINLKGSNADGHLISANINYKF